MSRAVPCLPFAAALVAACASAGDAPSSAGVVVGDSSVMSGALDNDRESPGGAKAVNPATEPESPWLGAIGLRGLLAGVGEVGFGFLVPDPFDPRRRGADAAAQVRDLGAGVWLKLDF